MKRFNKSALLVLLLNIIAMPAMAQDGGSDSSGLIALGTGITISLAAFGGAIGQAIAAKAALEGIARNPSAEKKLFTPMIIGLALIESLVIYALVIAFMMVGKI